MAALTEDMVLSRTRAKSLGSIKKLNCWGTGVSNVSILRKMPNVEVVTLSVNEVGSLKDFAYCSELKELYLRRNCLDSLEEIRFLKNLPHLKVLWIADNPCSQTENYRSTVLKNLPNIQKLDNIEVCSDDIDQATICGEEYSTPDDIPVFTEAIVGNIEEQESRIPEIVENRDSEANKFQTTETSKGLLDETNKLRTQLGIKPLVIDEPVMNEEKNVSLKTPLSPKETSLTTSTKQSNALSAILLLLSDLDDDELRIVQKEVVQKLDMNEESDAEDLDREVEELT